ncbi:hypothetical protein Tco_0122605 [Tanacetum coccineum]
MSDEVEEVKEDDEAELKKNLRLFGSKSRTVDVVLNLIINTIRFRLLSLNVKRSKDVGIAAKVWHLPYLGLKGDYVFIDNMDIDDRDYSDNFTYVYGCNDAAIRWIWCSYSNKWICTIDKGSTFKQFCYGSIGVDEWPYETLNFDLLAYESFSEDEVLVVMGQLFLLFGLLICAGLVLRSDGMKFEVRICVKILCLESGVGRIFMIEEFQEMMLYDDLNCCSDCIDWHEVSKKIQLSVVFFFPPFSLLLASMCGDVSMYVGWS